MSIDNCCYCLFSSDIRGWLGWRVVLWNDWQWHCQGLALQTCLIDKSLSAVLQILSFWRTILQRHTQGCPAIRRGGSGWLLQDQNQSWSNDQVPHQNGWHQQDYVWSPGSGKRDHYHYIGFQLRLARIYQPYIWSYYIPVAGMVLVASISFWISPDSIPGRVALLITLALTLISFFIGIQVHVIYKFVCGISFISILYFIVKYSYWWRPDCSWRLHSSRDFLRLLCHFWVFLLTGWHEKEVDENTLTKYRQEAENDVSSQ